jgi:hypothetical protein
MGNQRGQHTLEFAILIGLVALAAVTMQFVARRGVQTGVQMVSDTVLGPPPAPEPDETTADLTLRRCDGSTQTVTAQLVVSACGETTEQGTATFARTTTIDESVKGMSVNKETRLQVFEE